MRFCINIKTLTGKHTKVCVDSEETVGELKRRLYADERSQHRLIFGGRQLEDDRTLGDYNIQEESTIHDVLRLCGGDPSELENKDKGVPRTESMEQLALMQQEESSGWCSIM